MNYLPQNVYPVDSLLKLEIDGSRLLIIIITVNVSIAHFARRTSKARDFSSKPGSHFVRAMPEWVFEKK